MLEPSHNDELKFTKKEIIPLKLKNSSDKRQAIKVLICSLTVPLTDLPYSSGQVLGQQHVPHRPRLLVHRSRQGLRHPGTVASQDNGNSVCQVNRFGEAKKADKLVIVCLPATADDKVLYLICDDTVTTVYVFCYRSSRTTTVTLTRKTMLLAGRSGRSQGRWS